MAHLEKGGGKVRADLPPSRDQDVHRASYAARPGVAQMAWVVDSIAAEVAQTVWSPSDE
jgi:hypothetical protein